MSKKTKRGVTQKPANRPRESQPKNSGNLVLKQRIGETVDVRIGGLTIAITRVAADRVSYAGPREIQVLRRNATRREAA